MKTITSAGVHSTIMMKTTTGISATVIQMKTMKILMKISAMMKTIMMFREDAEMMMKVMTTIRTEEAARAVIRAMDLVA